MSKRKYRGEVTMTPILPDFDQATFEPGAVIDNPYFPLPLGRILSYEAEEEDEDNDIEDMEEDEDNTDNLDDESNGELEAEDDSFPSESNQVIVTFDNKNIQIGETKVQAVVVRDIAWEEGILVEDTFDWYAQDTVGNVWYLGELSTNYEYDDDANFLGTNTEGSWEAGIDGALPGYIMKANPQVGDSYYQEFYLDEAEDEAEVISLDASVSIDFGDFENVLQTREFTQLEPDAFEYKYFVPGIGQILAEEGITEEGGEPELSPELIDLGEFADVTFPALSTTTFEDSAVIDNPYFTLTPGTVSIYEEDFDIEDNGIERHEVVVTEETKDILGITSLVVTDSEYDDDVLTDEKSIYYAQDSQGNVWLLGETITEYEYDEAGDLVGTDDSDSWLAGEGQALPGLIMTANPQVGDAYYQRFDIGEVENQAEVVESDLDLTINGETFENVIKIKESSVLEPEESDFNYYAPDVGLVLEEEINEDGELVFASSLDSVALDSSSLQAMAQSGNSPFIDLLGAETTTTVELSTTANAGFDNVGGFYQAIDTEGTVIDPVSGAEVSVGDTGYEAAALASRVAEFGVTAGETLELDAGFVYVPYLLADGVEFFTAFAEANIDGLEHVQTIGEQNFAFEDLIGGGDVDFDDFIISVEEV